MAEHGYELEHIKTAYPEMQAESLEITIIPGLEWAMSKYDRPIMIDDSGLFIDALKGFPGVYSSYVFKTIGNDGILSLMRDEKQRSARFECCIGFKMPGKDPFIAKGIAMGFTLWFIVLYVALLFVLFGYFVLPIVKGKKDLLEH